LDELEKLHFIQSLVDKGHRVGVVSDGMFRAASDCVNICLGAAPDARPLDADLWLLRGGISSLARAHELAVHSAARLRRGHRISQASTGSMLVATSFDLLPPVVTALIGNAVTLDLVRRAKTTDTGDTI
jgi:cation transport ATPase